MAEGEGFEPSVRGKRTTVFETAPFDHSGTPPFLCDCILPLREEQVYTFKYLHVFLKDANLFCIFLGCKQVMVSKVSDKVCWTLTDGSAGMQSQAKGLAQALGIRTIHKICQLQKPWCWFPSHVVPLPLSKLSKESNPLSPPWPHVLITCGRRSVSLALAIKKASLGHTYCIHIQDPRVHPHHFDLIICPEHDNLCGDNVIQTQAALHCIDQAALKAGYKDFKEVLEVYPSPRVCVLLGGSTNNYRLTLKATEQMAEQLLEFKKAHQASLFISPSRRTGEKNIALLQSFFQHEPHVMLWDLKQVNPYLGFLAWADYCVVTNDSVNMISEAMATGKPIYTLELPNYRKAKPKAFAERLAGQGTIKRFDGSLHSWSFEPFNETERIATLIKNLWKRKGI